MTSTSVPRNTAVVIGHHIHQAPSGIFNPRIVRVFRFKSLGIQSDSAPGIRPIIEKRVPKTDVIPMSSSQLTFRLSATVSRKDDSIDAKYPFKTSGAGIAIVNVN